MLQVRTLRSLHIIDKYALNDFLFFQGQWNFIKKKKKKSLYSKKWNI